MNWTEERLYNVLYRGLEEMRRPKRILYPNEADYSTERRKILLAQMSAALAKMSERIKK